VDELMGRVLYAFNSERLWLAAIGVTTFITIVVTFVSLTEGFTIVFPHLFYLPIILTAYRYPRTGIAYAVLLSVLYLVMVASLTPATLTVLAAAAIRAVIFIAIGGVVSLLSGALQREELKYRTMFEHTGAATAVIRADGTIAMVNGEFVRLLASPEADLIGRPWQTILSPEDRKRFEPGTEGLVNGTFEIRLIRKDGTPLDVVATSGKTPYTGIMVFSCVDITEKKRAEEANLFLASIVESSDAIVTGQDLDGTIISWNPSAEKNTGYTAAEVLGRPSSIIVPPGREGEIAMILAKIKAGEHIEHFETVRVRKDGSRFDAYLIVSPIRNVEGEIIGASTITRDITMQKQVEENLKEANEEANLYLDIMAHDINNANTVSMGYADYFTEVLEGSEREFAHKLLSSVKKSVEIIGNVSTIRRLRQESAALRPVALDDVIREEIRHFAGTNVAYGGCSSRVMADDLLSEVFTNLIGNAVKFAGPDVRIGIAVSEKDDSTVSISVDDTGPGIADDDKPGIFTRFQRGKSKKSGKGLGLFIARMLVERYGGTIRAEDRVPGSPGEGARIVFTLQRVP
jgi:PAS domain S-box-containing protein